MICALDPAQTLFPKTGALVAHTCVKPKAKKCEVRVLNPTDDYITLYENQTIGVLHPVDTVIRYEDVNSLQDDVDCESETEGIPETIPLEKTD
jgi:hypothetical protein